MLWVMQLVSESLGPWILNVWRQEAGETGAKGHQGSLEGGWVGPGFAEVGRGTERERPARWAGLWGL